MKCYLRGLGVFLLALASWSAAASSASAGDLEQSVLAELNAIRAHPAAYARHLREAAQEGRGGVAVLARHDPAAVREAIAFLERQPALPPLSADGRLASAARAHVRAQGPSGSIGHGAAASGFGERLGLQKIAYTQAAEGISYGQSSGRDVVLQLVIDSGVRGRSHRRDVFGPAYDAAGVACGPHAVWGSMCVIDYAAGFSGR
ncbi:CAP domain-containing protein [Phenylobacterium deserti]|uniref:CAP domain-containing protein n=1 Tax=Phenylobacterium deserti TaxID=1914756 RepID=A0A328AVW1_9CAUL|nr:CAP domain-containing protein [Phenylobacterium deserti]RAK57836.1 CAP domain-containing protein [Phenylobacterium deserti]